MAVALPRRIWIVGPTGAGKSTLASALAARLGVPAIHLDDIHWQPGWVELPRAELIERVGPIVAGDAWVIDGNYSDVRRAHGSRAELFVWLDPPFAVAFFRVLRRTLSRAAKRELCCNGNTESLTNAFFTRDSVLLWVIHTHGGRRRQLTDEMKSKPHVRLRSAREVAAFLTRTTVA
jgi:adenylate kinase family enzyme